MKKTRTPVVLTVNGKAELIVLDRLERGEAVEAIRLGIASADEGRVQPARQALPALQEKLASQANNTNHTV